MKKLSLSVLSLLIFCAIVEGSLRLATLVKKDLVVLKANFYAPSDICPYELKANNRSDFIHALFTTQITTNSRGYRDNELDERPRILVIGDSQTFGFGVNDDETIAAHLERLDPSKDFVNLGFACGFSPDSYAAFLRKALPELKPQAIIVNLFQNDLVDVKGNQWERESNLIQKVYNEKMMILPGGRLVSARTKPDWVYQAYDKLSWAYSIKFIMKQFTTRVPQHLLPESQKLSMYERRSALFYGNKTITAADREKFKLALENLATLAQKSGVQLFVHLMGGHPEKQTIMDQLTFEQLGNRQGVQVIEFNQQLNSGEWYIRGDGHFNAKGTKKVAELLHEHLLKRTPSEEDNFG